MLQSLLGSVKQTGSIDLQDDYIQNPLFVGGFSLFFLGGGVLYGFSYNKGQGISLWWGSGFLHLKMKTLSSSLQ